MDTERLDLKDKALSLRETLGHHRWFTAIGLGEQSDGRPCIYVYASDLSQAKRAGAPSMWEDVPVYIRKMSRITPAGAAREVRGST